MTGRYPGIRVIGPAWWSRNELNIFFNDACRDGPGNGMLGDSGSIWRADYCCDGPIGREVPSHAPYYDRDYYHIVASNAIKKKGKCDDVVQGK